MFCFVIKLDAVYPTLVYNISHLFLINLCLTKYVLKGSNIPMSTVKYLS